MNDPDGAKKPQSRLKRFFQHEVPIRDKPERLEEYQGYADAVAYFSNLILLNPSCLSAYANRAVANRDYLPMQYRCCADRT